MYSSVRFSFALFSTLLRTSVKIFSESIKNYTTLYLHVMTKSKYVALSRYTFSYSLYDFKTSQYNFKRYVIRPIILAPIVLGK